EPVLPPWAEELRQRYLAGEASLFLVHGNVRDLHAWDDGSGRKQWLDVRGFLEAFFARTREVTAYYNVSQGLQFTDRDHARLFRSIVDRRRTIRGEPRLGELP